MTAGPDPASSGMKRLTVEVLGASTVARHAEALGAVLLDCVRGGASVSFMGDLNAAHATAFFAGCARAVEAGERQVLAAFLDGVPCGTVQLLLAMPPNQPHRAELAKLLVHRSVRGRGVAATLLHHAEREARRQGRSLLCLDTAAGEAGERLYARLGYHRAGTIPNYALFPDGRPCDTVLFWKTLDGGGPPTMLREPDGTPFDATARP